MFLGVSPEVTMDQEDESICVLTLRDNPLGKGWYCRYKMCDDVVAEFVELPSTMADLRYSNILCGVIRGALESVSLKVETEFISDILLGQDKTEIKIQLVEVIEEAAGDDYKVE